MLSITGPSAVPKPAPPTAPPALETSACNCCGRQRLERMKQVREIAFLAKHCLRGGLALLLRALALPRAHLHALLVAATSRRGRRTSQKRSPGRVCMNGRGRRRRSLHSTLLRCQTDCGYAFEPHRRRSTLREHNSTNKKPTGSNPQCSCLGTALCAMVHRLVKLRSQFPVRTLWALRDACCANAPHP